MSRSHEADRLIESFTGTGHGFIVFRFVGSITAKPDGGLCAGRYGPQL